MGVTAPQTAPRYAIEGDHAAVMVVRENATNGAPKPKLLDQVRQRIRARHYSRRTEKAYVHWIKRSIFFHDKRHPVEMGAVEITAFLTSLAVRDRVAASTQNQALNALLFLYREVLEVELPWLDGLVRAKRPERLPVVLTRDEVQAVIDALDGVPRLLALLLYGAGLRLLECCRLRVKDVDFAVNQVMIRDGKGSKDRMTMLHGAGWVELPWALGRKYPSAGREWGWQWVFPATRLYIDRASGERRRHHLHESVVLRAVREAVLKAGIVKRATCQRRAARYPGTAQRTVAGQCRVPTSASGPWGEDVGRAILRAAQCSRCYVAQERLSSAQMPTGGRGIYRGDLGTIQAGAPGMTKALKKNAFEAASCLFDRDQDELAKASMVVLHHP